MFGDNPETADLTKVIEAERQAVETRRQRLHVKGQVDADSALFGLALSGGGVRSATINLGFLKVLNQCGILHLADYLSTVSGGGYLGGYIQTKLKSGPDLTAYSSLFTQEDIAHLQAYGNYLTPGKSVGRIFTSLRLFGAFIFSLLMNLIWVVTLFFTLLFAVRELFDFIFGQGTEPFYRQLILNAALILIFAHFFLHVLRHMKLWSAEPLYWLEGILLPLAVIYLLYDLANSHLIISGWGALSSVFGAEYFPRLLRHDFPAAFCLFILTGFFANPNVLTMHRFYRNRLAVAFMKTGGNGDGALKLHELKKDAVTDDCGIAPYPLINACLNLLGREDGDKRKFKGLKTCDYFTFSPLFCGSKLTGYVDTSSPGYKDITLATAVAVSGAAVNPDMGTKSKRPLAFLMTLLNLRLGYWILNPAKKVPSILSNISWWPYYHLAELFSATNTRRLKVNISDGGHIENLGIYELLRRKCSLIVAIDASADPYYDFDDLRNIIIRARNELGLCIKFRQSPEAFIRPKPSAGFSDSHFVIADISEIEGKSEEREAYAGLLVYVKSSLLSQKKFKRIDEDKFNNAENVGFFYKVYHPTFPHESTADQFFDRDQWQAYYDLGRFMAGDLLRVDVSKDRNNERHESFDFEDISHLCERFNNIRNDADLMKYLRYMD